MSTKVNPYNQKLRIGSVIWKIEEMEEEKCPEVMGSCSMPYDATIKIDPELTGMTALETLIHESLHAISETDGSAGMNLDEKMVEKLSYRLSLFLAHNDWVMDYAKEKIAEEYGE